MQIPKNLLYSKNHLWLRKIGLVDYYVGITDFAQKEIGTIKSLIMESPGKSIKKNTCWGSIIGIEKSFSLIMPFDCKILITSKAEDLNNLTLNNNPYYFWFAVICGHCQPNDLLSHDQYKQLTK